MEDEADLSIASHQNLFVKAVLTERERKSLIKKKKKDSLSD